MTSDREIWLHVGLPKTGTTAIQEAFHANRKQLLKAGFLYPSLCDNHTHPVSAIYQKHAGENIRFHDYTPKQFASEKERFSRKFHRELSSPDWHVALISGEGIGHFSASEIDHLLRDLYVFADKIKIIVSLREPLALLSSTVQQNLKAGSTLEQQWNGFPVHNLRLYVSNLVDKLQGDPVYIWDFDRARCSDDNISRDFARCLGLSNDLAEMIGRTVVNRNLSYSQEACEILSARNQQDPAPVSYWYGRKLSKIKGPKFRIPHDVSVRAQRFYYPDYEWLLGNMPQLIAARPPQIEAESSWLGGISIGIETSKYLLRRTGVAWRKLKRRIFR